MTRKAPPKQDAPVSPLQFVDELVAKTGGGADAVIPILQAIQRHYRWLPPDALKHVCEITKITPAAIDGVASFYSQFRHQPMGRHLIKVCHGTACHVKGSRLVHEAFLRELGITGNADTDADGVFTVQKVACLGCCTLAPVIQIDEVIYEHLTPASVGGVLRHFLKLQASTPRGVSRQASPATSQKGEIRIGLGSCCRAKGSHNVRDSLWRAIAASGVDVSVKRVGCVGICHQTPLVEVVTPDKKTHLYTRMKPQDIPALVNKHFKPKGLRRIGVAVSTLLQKTLTDESWAPPSPYGTDAHGAHGAFLDPQRHIATEHCGLLDPLDVDEYSRSGGFAALKRVLTELAPEQLIDMITASGLRGRGGAGFPTGAKWSLTRKAPGEVKYVICNGDEGDPGAFMDRMLLESYPYRVIEGLIIAARAVGAREGIFYIRDEYPLAVEHVTEALKRCRERGLLGVDIMGSGFALDVRIMRGAGAFVCGEETALIASIEGRRGMPRLRPPYPAESGLWGKPTLINNVETLSLVPWIVRNGAEAFAAIGTPRSKGTKVFALTGKAARGGLIEVPMGITLRQIVEDIGGGVGAGGTFKAVQIGGPSGGCVPASMADTPVDYEALTAAGAIMGSGGLVVLDDSDCMVDIARYFLEFTQNQSCGRCTFCRIGTRRMLDILEGLCEGKSHKNDLEELERLALMVKRGSLCGLGQTAPNPVLTTLKHYRTEYEAHIAGRCPAGKCVALIKYLVTDDCIGCTRCAQQCPVDAITPRPYQKHEIDMQKCVRCGTCRDVCPAKAIMVR